MSRIAREKPSPGFTEGIVKYPRLPAYMFGKPGREQFGVWCCWCDCWHFHGAVAKEEYGHRVAHCHTDSPYQRTGYVLTDPKTLARRRG